MTLRSTLSSTLRPTLRSTLGRPSGFSGLLDQFPDGAIGLSLRLLNSQFANLGIVSTRRASDGDIVLVKVDKSFAQPKITLNSPLVGSGSTFGDFVSGTDGFVDNWIDQFNIGGNDATQATTTAQPKIVSAGSLVTGGIDFDGVDDFLNLGDLALTQPVSVAFVHNSDDTLSSKNDFLDHNGTGDRTLIDISSNNYRLFSGSSAVSSKPLSAGSDALVFTTISNTSSELSLNGSNETGLSPGTQGMGEMTLGKSLGGSYDGTFAEFIIWGSSQSVNRAAIEANINDFYGIYGASLFPMTFPLTLA